MCVCVCVRARVCPVIKWPYFLRRERNCLVRARGRREEGGRRPADHLVGNVRFSTPLICPASVSDTVRPSRYCGVWTLQPNRTALSLEEPSQLFRFVRPSLRGDDCSAPN